MKVRTGFVSNSSSSSFIVAFPKKPSSRSELGTMMFGEDYDPMGHVCQYDKVVHNGDAVNDVFQNINEFDLKGKKLKDRMLELCSNKYGYFDHDPELEKLKKESNRLLPEYWKQDEELKKKLGITDKDYNIKNSKKIDKYNAERKKLYEPIDIIHKKEDARREVLGKKEYEEFVKNNKNAFFFITSYSDNDGDFGCVMEHGNVFNNLPHITISNH